MPSLLDTYKGSVNPDDFRKSLIALGVNVPTPPAPTNTAAPASAPSTPPVPSSSVPTPKFEQGNPYNEILYSKNQYEAPGASDGTKSWAADNAQQFYAMLSPEEASKVHDMNASQLEAYIPKPPTQQNAAPVTPAPSVPAPSTPYTMTPDQIRAEAQARINKQRTALSQAVGATKTGLKNTFDYTNQLTRDNRTLEDESFKDRVNPFGGRFDYLKNNVLRDRSIQDTSSQNQYNAAVSAADLKLADFDANAPEQTDALYNELQRIERDYGLQVGQLTGNFNGTPTLAAKTSDQNYQLGLSGLSGVLPGGGGQTLAARNQTFSQDMANRQFDRGVLESDRNFDYQQARDSIKDTQYQQQFDENVRQFGLDYAMRKAGQDGQLANQAADNARAAEANRLAQKRFEYEKDPNNPDNIYKKAQIDAIKNKPTSGDFNLDDYKSHINTVYYKVDPNDPTGRKRIFDSEGAKAYIDGLTLSQAQKDQLYEMNNIPKVSDSDIAQFLKK